VYFTALRDHDHEVVDSVPSLALGAFAADGDLPAAAQRAHQAGARRVRLTDPVDARSPDAAPALVFVRELSRFGVVVDWDLVLDPAAHDWREFSNLYPPRRLLGATGLTRWRESYFPGKFIVRLGPGFVQVRDWRWARYRVTTIAAAGQVDLIRRLLAEPVPAGTDVAALDHLRLVHRVGDLFWMPAHRVWRWPSPAERV
jgi:hypothetical protein